MEAPGGTPLPFPAAHQAPPGRVPQVCPIPLAPPGIQHVQIEQTAQGVPILNVGAQRFDRPPAAGHHPQGLTSGRAVDLLPVDRPKGGAPQAVLQAGQPLPKGPADYGAVFHRAGNVQGKGDHRQAVLLQQGLLSGGARLPCLQHLHQGHFRFHRGPPCFSSERRPRQPGWRQSPQRPPGCGKTARWTPAPGGGWPPDFRRG